MQRVPAPAAPIIKDPAALTAKLLQRLAVLGIAIGVPLSAPFLRAPLFTLLPFATVLIMIAAAFEPPPLLVSHLRSALLTPLAATAFLLLVWSLLSLLWTPFIGDAGPRVLKVGGSVLLTMGAILLLPKRTRIATLYLLPIGVGLTAILTVLLAVAGLGRLSGGIEGNHFTLARATAINVVLFWPALATLAIRERWMAFVGVAVAAVAAEVATGSIFGLVALAVGAAAFLGMRRSGQRTARGLAALTILIVAVGPLLPFLLRSVFDAIGGGLPVGLHPVALWADTVSGRWGRLITGHGLETMPQGIAHGLLPEGLPRTVLFQVWYELGIIGAAAVAAIVALSFLSVDRTSSFAPYTTAGIASTATLTLLDHNISQLWWMMALCVAALSQALVIRGQYKIRRPAVRPAV